MMRENRFRGKAKMNVEKLDEIGIKHDNGWVYGNLIADGNIAFIVGGIVDWSEEYLTHEWWVEVDPETIGQYTGLKDKNGVEIYEGDIIKYKNVYEWKVNPVEIQPVVYEQGMFTVPGAVKFMGKDCEVIGNIYEHPELLRTSS